MVNIPKDLKGPALQDFLEHNSDVQSDEIYFRPFDQSELDDVRRQYAELSIKLADKNKSFAEAKKEHSDACKMISKDVVDTLASVRRRGREENGRCYTFKDFETFMVTTVNRFGSIINHRAMTPEEKQLQIPSNVRQMAVNQ